MYLLEKEKFDIYLRKIIDNKEKRNIYNNSKLRCLFLELLKYEAELLNTVNKKDDIDSYFTCFSFLVRNGYLSYNDNFIVSSTCIELTMEPGISIVSGSGCCRNLSPHFNLIMNFLNNDTKFIIAGTNYLKKQYKLGEEETKDEPQEKTSLNYKNILLPTHIESFSTKNKALYDVLNFRIQRFYTNIIQDDFFLGLIDLAFDALFNSNLQDIERENSLKDLLNYSNILSTSKRTLDNKSDILALKEEGKFLCQVKYDRIKTFQDKVRPLQKEIIKQTKIYQNNGY